MSFLLPMQVALSSVRQWFWSEYIWLPPNITWETYRQTENGIKYAQFNDLYLALYTAIAFIIIRFVFENFFFISLAIYIGIRPPKHRKILSNERLEKAFRMNPNLDHKQIRGLSKQLDMSERKVERWLRIRTSMEKPSTLKKFCESAWRCLFYSFAFSYGVWTLWDKSWTYDSMFCFIDYPHHSVDDEIWWYYNIELGFYLSLTVSQFFDIKRKDFWQMFIHHVVTILLLSFSWACNLHRAGSLVLIIHDFADIPMEWAKIARYMRNPSLANIVFTIFTVAWIYSRLGLLPYRVIAYSSYYALRVVPMFPAYYIFNGLLCCLQILHIVWTWLILRIAHNAIFAKGVTDLRESDDTTVDESADDGDE